VQKYAKTFNAHQCFKTTLPSPINITIFVLSFHSSVILDRMVLDENFRI